MRASVLADDPEGTQRKRLEVGARPQDAVRLALDALAVTQGGEGIEVSRHRAEVEPVGAPDCGLAEERRDGIEVAAVESELNARRVQHRSVAGHAVLLSTLLETSRLRLLAAIGMRDRADKERSWVSDARGGSVVGNGVLDRSLQLDRAVPIAAQFLELEQRGDTV